MAYQSDLKISLWGWEMMAGNKDAWRPFHSWVKSSCLEACAAKVHEGLLGFGMSIVRAWVVSIVCEDGRDCRLLSALNYHRI